jgi:hypothetical protein
MLDLVPLHDTYLSENHLMNYYEYYTYEIILQTKFNEVALISWFGEIWEGRSVHIKSCLHFSIFIYLQFTTNCYIRCMSTISWSSS